MLGARIREIRKNKRMTLSDIAEMTQFTPGYISQLERDIIDPSLSALRKIAKALGVPVYIFLEEPDIKSIKISADKRLKMELPDTNITYEFLTPMISNYELDPKMVMIYFQLNPESWSSEESIVHNADECIFALKGSVEVYLGEEKHCLSEGDSIYIKENVPHKLYNPCKEKIIGISTITPAIY